MNICHYDICHLGCNYSMYLGIVNKNKTDTLNVNPLFMVLYVVQTEMHLLFCLGGQNLSD